MTEDRLSYLIEKHYSSTLTQHEWDELINWYSEKQEAADWIGKNNEERYVEVMSGDIMQKLSDGRSGKKPVTMPMLKWAVAAVVILSIGSAWIYYTISGSVHSPDAVVADVQQEKAVRSEYDTIYNNGSNSKSVVLPDGSRATIFAQSAIAYPGTPVNDRRKVMVLAGRVFFDVKQDKKKPFVVYSGNISTTALGTSFTVLNKNRSVVKILLHSGKVVVRRESDNNTFKPVYLLPGKEVSVNTETWTAVLATTPVKKIASRENANDNIKNRALTIKFEQESLSTVLQTLSSLFKTSIQFDSTGIGNLEFTGTIRTASGLEATLEKIALLNGLSMEKRPEGYALSKK